jgi:hypothetical protein
VPIFTLVVKHHNELDMPRMKLYSITNLPKGYLIVADQASNLPIA